MKAHRILAYLIDAVLIGIVCGIVCAITGLRVQTLWTSGTGFSILYNPVTLLSLGVSVVYFLSDVMSGGSPGKKLLGLSVISEPDKDGFPTAATRALVKVLSIHLIVGIVLFFMSASDSSFHDKVSGTHVQKKMAVA